MSQSNHSVGNVSAPVFRADMNASLQALASLNSGATAPSTTYANMLWYDSFNNILKMRSEADDTWINVAYLDQTANAFRVLDDTQVVNTSGTQTGLLGDQATATWESGVATTESLVSPAKVKAAIDSQRFGLGIGQTWQSVSRTVNTSYLNNTGKPIHVLANTGAFSSGSRRFQVSSDNSTWNTVSQFDISGAALVAQHSVIVPNGVYYRAIDAVAAWWELR